jgi:hypothetical protein
MPLITLFTAPKALTDPHIALIQRNALMSWRQLPEVETLLLGDESGLASIAAELGARHLPLIARNSSGTPLISSMFELARRNSNCAFLCIINADMILLPDFLDAARQVTSLAKQFVMLSQRWDVDLRHPLEFSEGWDRRLNSSVHAEGRLHRPAGSDYFLFPRTCFSEVPAFAIGRGGWDNWMIYHARRQGWRVIDATAMATVVHQDHGYAHLPGGRPHYSTPETDENIRLAGGQAATRYTLLDSTDRLVSGALKRPVLTSARLARRLELLLREALSFLPDKRVESLVRPKRWLKRIRRIFR